MNGVLDIAAVVEASGLQPSTLHVWERHGLIAACGRVGLRRQYDASVLDRIAVIVTCQRSGFTLAEIADLMRPDAFAAGKSRLEAKLAELRERRRQLDVAIDGLEHALACPEPEPMHCPRFRRTLRDVLPVRRR